MKQVYGNEFYRAMAKADAVKVKQPTRNIVSTQYFANGELVAAENRRYRGDLQGSDGVWRPWNEIERFVNW